jgi:uncharacterized protein (DUF1499 family)
VPIARRIIAALVVAGLVAGAGALAVRIYMGRPAEDRLERDERVEIARLQSPLPRASRLTCPPGYCAAAEAVASPIFDLPWQRLRDYWNEVVAGNHRVVMVETDPEVPRIVYIERSPLLRFPDLVTVEFVALGPDRSSIAIYSRSRYGKYDFAKNRKRVERWLFTLRRIAGPAAESAR